MLQISCVYGDIYQDLHVTHLVGLHWALLHVEVPYFDSQVVSGEQITSTMAKLNIRNWRDDLREERSIAWVLWLLKDWGEEKQQIQTSSESLEIVRMGKILSAHVFNTLAINHQVFCVCQRLLVNGFSGFTLNDLITAMKHL